jgi:hypothetical protein
LEVVAMKKKTITDLLNEIYKEQARAILLKYNILVK